MDEPDEYDEPELVRVELLDELERLVDGELDERELLPLDERELLPPPLLGRELLPLNELPPPGRASEWFAARRLADDVNRPRSQVRRFMKRLPRQQARLCRQCGAGGNRRAINRIRGRLVRKLRSSRLGR